MVDNDLCVLVVAHKHLHLQANITGLINAVGEYFNMRAHASAARQQAGIKNSRHIPTTIQACNYYRNRMLESMQKLHSLTWEVSIRRVNCFSQVSATSRFISCCNIVTL